MNFDHPDMEKFISKIPPEKLLIIDWNIHASPTHSYVCQDFGQALYDVFEAQIEKIKRYNRFIYLYPEKLTYHPRESIINFKRFVNDFSITGEMLYDPKKIEIKQGDLYLLVSDRTLSMILDQATEKGLEPGRDFGIISYNETPMKRFVKEGITVLSTNFTQMGKRAAEFVLNTEQIQEVVPIRLIERNSF